MMRLLVSTIHFISGIGNHGLMKQAPLLISPTFLKKDDANLVRMTRDRHPRLALQGKEVNRKNPSCVTLDAGEEIIALLPFAGQRVLITSRLYIQAESLTEQ